MRDSLDKQFIIGPTAGNSGGPGSPTGFQGLFSEAAVSQWLGKYALAAINGMLFGCQEQGSGVAPGTALGTTACLALYNPRRSGKLVIVKKVSLGYISGTLGAGTVFHCANVPADAASGAIGAIAAPSSGTALSVYPRRLGGEPGQAAGASLTQARVGATVTAPVALRAFCGLQASLASTAVGPWIVTEDVDGEFVIEPGYCYQLQAVAAGGSTPLVSPGAVWMEVPIVR